MRHCVQAGRSAVLRDSIAAADALSSFGWRWSSPALPVTP